MPTLGEQRVLRWQRHFVGDGLAGALHHERQRHDMGLTIHYQLATTGDEAHSRKLVQQLRQAALDLPFRMSAKSSSFGATSAIGSSGQTTIRTAGC